MAFRLLCLLAVLFSSLQLSAQDYGNVRFGKLTDEDLAALPPLADSAAAAYVLYDRLDLSFDYLSGKGATSVEEFHKRIKLLTPAAFDRANVSIRYNRTYEDISGLKALIHLPNGERIKLSGRDFVRERDDDYITLKFTFPRVAAGAVLEYSYSKRSESILIPSRFAFQQDVPVRWAEYTAMIPEYYRYVSLGTSGQYAVNEVKTTRRPWGPVFRKVPTAHESVSHNDIRWVMQDVAAFTKQPYTNNATDYLPRVRLQLQSVDYPGELTQPVFSNWEETVEALHERTDFGKAYTNRSNYNKLWKAAGEEITQLTGTRERIDAAYAYVCRNLRWNGDIGFIGTDSPNQVFERGEGNSADLNLALLALLQEAGIPAHPLLVSLRDGGTPVEIYPILTQFAHLMVYTEVDGAPYILDANGNSRSPGLPRIEALNHRGWVADPDAPRWVDVEAPVAKQVVMANITLDEAGAAHVDLQGQLDSYFAFAGRQGLARMESPVEAPVARDIAGLFPEMEVINQEVSTGEDDPAAVLGLKMQLDVPASLVADDYIYLQPVLLPILDDELDDVDERLYPIDFPYPWQINYIANVNVPEGYVVEEMPESIRFISEDRGMEVNYSVSNQTGNLVTVVFRVSLRQTVYPPTAYPALRSIFQRIIELQQANIVFRRA